MRVRMRMRRNLEVYGEDGGKGVAGFIKRPLPLPLPLSIADVACHVEAYMKESCACLSRRTWSRRSMHYPSTCSSR